MPMGAQWKKTRHSWTISQYLIRTVLPYFVFSWLLLSVILFVQQAGRFSDIFFSANIPSNLIWQLSFALVPSVIAFTCPMAALVGVIIGLSKMQGDSELVAIRAVGVDNFRITLPMAVLGLLLSCFAFVVNLYGVPLASRMVRRVALQTAVYKLESPIEPGVFNTEVAGYTIYVKDGDISTGEWKNVFISNEDEGRGIARLITSDSGRIDYTDDASELVLNDAVLHTISSSASGEKYVAEKVDEIRYTVKTRRGEIAERLGSAEMSPEELGLSELSEYAGRSEGRERTEAQILWQRRIILSITPLIFCLLGSTLVLRYTRGGRGFGVFIALVSLVVFFLLAFLGEQLARTGRIHVLAGGVLPLVVSSAAIMWLATSSRLRVGGSFGSQLKTLLSEVSVPKFRRSPENVLIDLTAGIRDFDLLLNLLRFYLLTLGFLGSIFIIFTAFELWKFAGSMENGVGLLGQYLFFLLPYIYIQLSPSAAMIAILATYVIKSRQNEMVTWTSAGLSVYRLFMPAFVATLLLGGLNYALQETILPGSNEIQDTLRAAIRSRGQAFNKGDTRWVAGENRIYSFKPGGDSGEDCRSVLQAFEAHASDNEQSDGSSTCVLDLEVYQFRTDGPELQAMYRIPVAVWRSGQVLFSEGNRREFGRPGSKGVEMRRAAISAPSNPFVRTRTKPSHLNISETSSHAGASDSEVERRMFEVALHKKYATLLLPFVIALFTAPFALSLSRKGKAVTVGYAIGLWLLFIGIVGVFEQLGLNGYVVPAYSVWGPLALFSMFGVILLSRVRT